jgi:DHA1 family tetracycline resistance protein-like MFS transporter
MRARFVAATMTVLAAVRHRIDPPTAPRRSRKSRLNTAEEDLTTRRGIDARIDNVAPYIGIMMALYAAMQFIVAPVMGALGDRLDRRPVLLISLTDAKVNYLFLAFAPSPWRLLVGRALAGLTSANTSVAAAYVTDISSEDTRARSFGLLNAMFGIGFIVGPVLSGLLGDYWVRLPFLAAAVLTGINLMLCFLALAESHPRPRQCSRGGI